MVHRFRRNVVFANPHRVVARLGQSQRQATDPIEGAEVMIGMFVAVVAVVMIVQAGEDDRTRSTAARRRTKGMLEDHSLGRQGIHVWRFDRSVSISTDVRALIIGDE